MIGILLAMQAELNPYLVNNFTKENIYGKEFYRTKIGKQEVVFCLAGIGKVNAAFSATIMIERYKPFLIISTGVSGGLGIRKPYEIVVADKVVQHDVDTTALGDPKGMVSTINKIYFETSEKYSQLFLANITGSLYGTIASGDQFIAEKELSKAIVNNFGAIACDMESGAIAQIAYLAGTEFVIIRGISDGADENAPVDFFNIVQKVSEIIYNSIFIILKKI